jgi:hypothetical protein
MLTWQELDKQFQALSPALASARLDIQWGAAGEYLRVAAYFDVEAKERFRALSMLAGDKLARCLPPDSEVHKLILAESDPALRWWKALWHLSKSFQFGFMGFQKTDTGEDAGTIYTGSINNPTIASATLAIEMLARYGEPEEVPVCDDDSAPRSLWRRVVDAVSLKPGAFGVSVDLKQILKGKKD